mmetsp:Transcript_18205/g.45931  ORF Transcript_18205/g.45931 Transcript_18205/m.45931 type:complete len:212 (-) Transcript_18205:107-742(-)
MEAHWKAVIFRQKPARSYRKSPIKAHESATYCASDSCTILAVSRAEALHNSLNEAGSMLLRVSQTARSYTGAAVVGGETNATSAGIAALPADEAAMSPAGEAVAGGARKAVGFTEPRKSLGDVGGALRLPGAEAAPPISMPLWWPGIVFVKTRESLGGGALRLPGAEAAPPISMPLLWPGTVVVNPKEAADCSPPMPPAPPTADTTTCGVA